MDDVFLREQLELLRKLNERVSKMQDDVIHNVELLSENRRAAERWRREERLFRQRSSEPGHMNLGRRKDDRPHAASAPHAAVADRPRRVDPRPRRVRRKRRAT